MNLVVSLSDVITSHLNQIDTQKNHLHWSMYSFSVCLLFILLFNGFYLSIITFIFILKSCFQIGDIMHQIIMK